MPNPVFCLENDGNRVYQVGRVGLDSSGNDDGGVYTAILRTEKWAPAGEGEDVYFRNVTAKVRHTGSFVVTMRAYVDGVQTQYYSGGVLTDQEYVHTQTAPPAGTPGGVMESLVEMEIAARGNHIEVEMEIDSDDITGIFLPEYIEIQGAEVRLQRATGGGNVV